MKKNSVKINANDVNADAFGSTSNEEPIKLSDIYCSKPKKKKDNYRGRVHNLLLYPDCVEHMEALDVIQKSYDYAEILHDRDFFTAEDEAQDPEHKAGELKKPHYHVVLRTANATWRSALAKQLNITENYIKQARSFDNSLMYLIHFNDLDKAQYDIELVKGPLKTRLKEALNKIDKSEGEKVKELIDYIKNCNDRISVTDFASYCAEFGYWAEFRRSGSIFCKILEEHNQRYTFNKQREEA